MNNTIHKVNAALKDARVALDRGDIGSAKGALEIVDNEVRSLGQFGPRDLNVSPRDKFEPEDQN